MGHNVIKYIMTIYLFLCSRVYVLRRLPIAKGTITSDRAEMMVSRTVNAAAAAVEVVVVEAPALVYGCGGPPGYGSIRFRY